MKRIWLLLFSFFLCLNVSSQIQRQFFGLQLAETTIQEAWDRLSNIGENIDDKDNIIIVENVRFGGYNWPFAFFRFYDNVLCSVSFSASELITGKSSVDDTFNSLKKKLDRKYSEYYIKEHSNGEFTIYNDNVTDLMLRYSYYGGENKLIIMYSDLKMMEAEAQRIEDEL